MKQEHEHLQNNLSCIEGLRTIPLFAGIELAYLSLTGNNFSIQHKEASHILVINYCKRGRIGWKMASGNYVYLGPGDFSVHTMNLCAKSEINLPNGYYEGVAIYVDLGEFTSNPPAILSGTGVMAPTLAAKLNKYDMPISFAGNEQTDNIFSFFFHQPENMQLAYQKIKTLELLLYLYKADNFANGHITEYKAEQIEIIRKIHEQLLSSLDKRTTIEELAKQHSINPTTLKALFKSVYGTSVAAHMKEHRMRKAAAMLLETEMSIAEIALAVGYDSQSKFSSAFKESFQSLPREYRKKHLKMN